ncbi:MAG: preprotein translocase subunit YajC [Lachnospiraceae bacterium]|jgi:preprotein translocase subunit YajC|nr:preprotein translocase subunit YajC [Lachnospiraceae bacterium]
MISLLEATSAANPMGGGSFLWIMVIYIVVIGGAMYFISYRPQKKQQREMQALLDSLEVGDSVLTTSGFYGVVIDIKDEIVIVEFGSNKNCRIPMKKTAITEVEKAGGAEN